MGKLGSPRSPRPHHVDVNSSCGMKEYQLRCSDSVMGYDPSFGRRLLGGENHLNTSLLFNGLKHDAVKLTSCKGIYSTKRHNWVCRHLRLIAFMVGLMGLLLWLDSLMFSNLDYAVLHGSSDLGMNSFKKDDRNMPPGMENSSVLMYSRLLNFAIWDVGEVEFRNDASELWNEPFWKASAWKPCADMKTTEDPGIPSESNGYMLVSANGGLNQQRVAVCNAVAVAALLNATLVIPKFLYSNVWMDPSQFRDIYEEEHFINTLKNEVEIVKELPHHLQSLDLEAIGSVLTDADLIKEAQPADYIRLVLPILLRNGVVHFLGYGNRLGFDPFPVHLQKLRCKCNFHALKFAPKIQQVGSLLLRRIRKYDFSRNALDKQLLGTFMPEEHSQNRQLGEGPYKYLALHMRFEVDMVAYSLCEFGGGERERKELQAYRETHFLLLLERLKKLKPVSPEELRISGRCPLTPEEAALVLAGLGFKRGTYIYLASSHIYGEHSRMQPFINLYPNLVTKEDLLSPSELEPFRKFSSQLAALDFIACASADVFAITDSGSQLSSLVSGFRTYFGGIHAPTLRPNKKRLAAILMENGTLTWHDFQGRVRKMIKENQQVQVRRYGRSIYRQPRSPGCMCMSP